ncbi:MAG: glycosyltransferase family 2 protein [Pseudoxanthomonas sp.]
MVNRPLAMQDTVVVIPALNERLRIREVVLDALSVCPRVIVVDDGSDDGTGACIADLPATLIRHPQRRGKGAAMRSGFAEAARLGAAGVFTMDGDGQHQAADFPRLLAAANAYPGWVVNGARLRKRACQPWIRRLGNDFGDWGIAWACGFRMVDSQCGQRFYPASVYTLADVPGEGFAFEAQLLISAARYAGARVVSVPIEARYAGSAPGTFRESHFRLLRDLWQITAHVVAQVWRRGRILHWYAQARRHPPVIHDPGGGSAAVPAPLPMDRTG